MIIWYHRFFHSTASGVSLFVVLFRYSGICLHFLLFIFHIYTSFEWSFLSHTRVRFSLTPVHSSIHSLMQSHSVRCRTHSHSVCFSFVPNLFSSFFRFPLIRSQHLLIFFVFSSYSVPLTLFLILCIRLSCNNRLYCSHIVLFALLFILICFFFSFYFQNDTTAAVDYPNSATIFAAVCACLFIVIGIAGKCARFKWNRKLNIRFCWKKFVYLHETFD